MSYRIRVSRKAAAQIREACAWWLANRTKAPRAFEEELERGFVLASSMPAVGEPVAHPRPGIRRILLGRIRYYLYYRVSRRTETVEILSLWHTSRGTRPDL